MRKLLLSSAALVALSSAAVANPFQNGYGNHFSNGTGSTTVNVDISKTHRTTTTTVDRHQWDNYSGIGTYSSAEHGGISDIKTNGKAAAATVGVNFSTAKASGAERSVDLSAGLQGSILNIPVSAGLNANLTGRALNAETSSVSGSAIVAGAAFGGSLKAESAGYAAGSAAAYKEWGNSYQHTYQHDVTNQTRWQGTGSITRTR